MKAGVGNAVIRSLTLPITYKMFVAWKSVKGVCPALRNLQLQ